MRRDACLDQLKPGVKQDNWCALRNAPFQSYGPFPDDVLRMAEEDINKFESDRQTTQPGSGSGGFPYKKANRLQPYPSAASGTWKQDGTKSHTSAGDQTAWRSFCHKIEPSRTAKGKGRGGFPKFK